MKALISLQREVFNYHYEAQVSFIKAAKGVLAIGGLLDKPVQTG